MENLVFNKCQTPLEDLELNKYPQEVQNEKIYTVYRHISPNGKVYVGITKLSLSSRWNHGRGYKHCKLFYRAIQKYGWDNFQHCVVCTNLSKGIACLLERHLIAYYKRKKLSYNTTDGGEGTAGFHMPNCAKKKISVYQRKLKSKPVLQYTIDGEFVREFESATEAAKILGYGHSSVINCASRGKKLGVLHGYIFIYKEDIDSLDERIRWCKECWYSYKIVQYDGLNVVNVFNSIREAERKTNINRVCIRKNINGKFKRAGNYTWKKVKEENVYGNDV